MLQPVRLVMDGLRHLLITMADADSQNPTEEVQELFSLGVVNIVVLRMVDYEGFVVVGGNTGEEIFFCLSMISCFFIARS